MCFDMSGRKILILTNTFSRGGAELNALELAQRLRSRKLIVEMMATKIGKESNPRFGGNSSHLLEHNTFSRFVDYLLKVKRLRKIIRSGEYSIIISYLTNVNILLLISGLGCSYKGIVCERSSPFVRPRNTALRGLRNLLYTKAYKVVLQTECCASYYRRNGLDNLAVIPNFIRTFNVTKVEPAFKFDDNIRYLLTVGRSIESKNIKFLMGVFELLASKISNVEFIVIGDGERHQELIDFKSVLNSRDSIHLIRGTERLDRFYEKSDVFLFASLYEGFPNVLVEAMKYSLPVVALDCMCGPADIIDDRKNGFLLPLDAEPGQFARMIEELLKNNSLYTRFQNNCAEKSNQFSSDKILVKWLNLINGFDEN